MERKQIRRLTLVAAAAVVLVVVLVWVGRRAPVPLVGAVRVDRQNLTETVSTNGKVEAIDPAVIRAELNAFVLQVAATEGKQVHKGQLLLRLDTSDAQAQLARTRQLLLDAQDSLRSALAGGPADQRAQLDADQKKAEAEVERLRAQQAALKRLETQQAATPEDVSQNQLALTKAEATASEIAAKKEDLARRARLNVETSHLQIDRAKAEIATLERMVRQGNLTAPIDGTLYLMPVQVGDYVHTGDLLAEIGSLAHLRVRAFVDEPELGPVEPGEQVIITWDALPNLTWEGVTEQVPKSVVPRNTRSVGEVLCSVENSGQNLLPNANVNVKIIVRQANDALVVPRGAVRDEGTHRYVFVVESGGLGVNASVLHRREVKLGISSATNFQVLDGVRQGEEVALPGDVDLADGIQVRAVMQKLPTGS
ncbi:MAG TPA: efflux RND transporter periplasmic adaptor subunit [Candidatus Acidoferrales bacterium]|nr:efflux RND transporter periplasmic adaptor subunit [Candidatus Acidoferrales bacterium]